MCVRVFVCVCVCVRVFTHCLQGDSDVRNVTLPAETAIGGKIWVKIWVILVVHVSTPD